MRKITLVLTIGFLPTVAILQTGLKSNACDVVAVVQASRDRHFTPGQRICEGQKINNPSAPVLIKCIDNKAQLWLTSAADLNKCDVPLSSRSSLRGNDQFFRARGSDQVEPTITTPSGGYSRSLQPTLVWRAVPGAERYSVTIWGENRQVVETTQRSLTEKTGMPVLTQGRTYTIIVKAFSNEGLLSKSVSTLTVLSR
jgi:hypothetical protein